MHTLYFLFYKGNTLRPKVH